jgi:hypothetical protein
LADAGAAAADLSALGDVKIRVVMPGSVSATAEIWRLGDLICKKAPPAAVGTWVSLAALLTTLGDFLPADLLVAFGFVTSRHLSGLLTIIAQPRILIAFLAAASVPITILRTLTIIGSREYGHQILDGIRELQVAAEMNVMVANWC